MSKFSDKNIVVRVPDVLVCTFKKRCKENYRTMSQVIRDLIEEYLKRPHSPHYENKEINE